MTGDSWIFYFLIQVGRMNDLSNDFNYFVTSCVSAFTIFSTWRTSKLSYAIYERKRKMRDLQRNQVVSVDELMGRGLKASDMVIVRGRVGTADGKEVVKTLGWGKTDKLAIQMKFTEAIYSNDSFNLKKDNYSLNMNDALKRCTIQGSHRITLAEGTKHSVLLRNFDQKDYSRVMEILSWNQTKASLTVSDHVSVFFLSLLRALMLVGSEGREGGYLRGLEVGKREVEAGLRIGAYISVLGSVGLTLDGDMFIEVNEIFKERLTEIQKLRDQIPALIDKRNMWWLGSLGGSIYLARRAYKYIKAKDIKIRFVNP